MEKAELIKAIKQARNVKRGFSQTVDLVVNLKGLDLKKPDHQVDFFTSMPHGLGKKFKVCALVGPELLQEAKDSCDTHVLQEDFAKYAKDKKKVRKLARDVSYFIGQANIMPQVASAFGRVLGPKGKMPNPKAGCIVPPKAALKPLVDKLQNTVRVMAKTTPTVQCRIGTEAMSDEQMAENLLTIYDQLSHTLPNGEANVRAAFVKLTMGSPVKIK
jgi:large subunit ribosomal protein L1